MKRMLIIVGIISIVLAFVCYNSGYAIYSNYETYGGDAYTGMQNATVDVANNVNTLIRVTRIGFSGILLVLGLICIVEGIAYKKISYKPLLEEINKNISSICAKEKETENKAKNLVSDIYNGKTNE